MDQETLIERLAAENEEFRRLRTEHQAYDQELEALKRTAPLSADQQWRMSELKKLKLMAKTGWRPSSGTLVPASRPDEVPRRRVARPLPPFPGGRRAHGGRLRQA